MYYPKLTINVNFISLLFRKIKYKIIVKIVRNYINFVILLDLYDQAYDELNNTGNIYYIIKLPNLNIYKQLEDAYTSS